MRELLERTIAATRRPATVLIDDAGEELVATLGGRRPRPPDRPPRADDRRAAVPRERDRPSDARARSDGGSSSTRPATGPAARPRSRRLARRAAEQAAATGQPGRAGADDGRRAAGSSTSCSRTIPRSRRRARERSRTASSSSCRAARPTRGAGVQPPVLDRWLAAVLETPGLDVDSGPGCRAAGPARRRPPRGRARRRHAKGRSSTSAPAAAPRDPAGRIAARSRGDAARGRAAEVRFPRALGGRDPEPHRSSGAAPRSRSRNDFGVAVAKALAPPAHRRRAVPPARAGRRARPALGRRVGGARSGRGGRGADRGRARADAPEGLLAIRKTGPTPPGFPRRAGVAKKRPLA